MGHLPNKTRAARIAAGLDPSPPRRPAPPPGPRLTLGELLSAPGSDHWVWAACGGFNCAHSAALPLAPLVIRWGWDTSGDTLRAALRCRACGHRGGALMLPSWVDIQVGIQSFPAARAVRAWGAMCNLYAVTKGQAAIREAARAMRDTTGNLPPLPAVFPDRMAPIVRTGADGVRELVMARWGFPPPTGNRPLTNVRNAASSWWKPWLAKPAHRCLVPVTSFCEPNNSAGDKAPSVWTWFARDESRPLMFFAGIWREWEGRRGTKTNPAEGKHLLFSFLTTDASPDVAPVHPDATPVLLLEDAAREAWLAAPWDQAKALQVPPPAGALHVVGRGEKQDA